MILTNLDLPPPKAWLQLGGVEHLVWVSVLKDEQPFILGYPRRRENDWPYLRGDTESLIYYNAYRLTYFQVNPITYLKYIREPVNRFQTHLRWNQTHKRFEPIR
jgi:hypothetical protein